MPQCIFSIFAASLPQEYKARYDIIIKIPYSLIYIFNLLTESQI